MSIELERSAFGVPVGVDAVAGGVLLTGPRPALRRAATIDLEPEAGDALGGEFDVRVACMPSLSLVMSDEWVRGRVVLAHRAASLG